MPVKVEETGCVHIVVSHILIVCPCRPSMREADFHSMVPTDGDTLYRNSFKKQRGPMAVLASNTWPFSGSYSSGLLQERFQKLLSLFEPVFCLRVIPELAFFRVPEPVGIGGNAQSPC